MFTSNSKLPRLAALAASLTLVFCGRASAQPVVSFDIQTCTGIDTVYVGVPSYLTFNFDAKGNVVLALMFPMEFRFQGPNLIGQLEDSSVQFSPVADTAYEQSEPNIFWWGGDSIDSLQVGLLDGGGDHWPDSGEVWRLNFVPLTQGSFQFDTIVMAPANRWCAWDHNADEMPFEIINYGRQYKAVYLTGDASLDGSITSGDVIVVINYVFKGGPAPDVCVGLADVDCSGMVTAADIIGLVNYVFKSGAPPCELSPLIPGTWPCPWGESGPLSRVCKLATEGSPQPPPAYSTFRNTTFASPAA